MGRAAVISPGVEIPGHRQAPVAFLQVICSAKNGVVAGDGDYDDDPESGFGLLDTVPDRLSTAPSHYKSPRTII